MKENYTKENIEKNDVVLELVENTKENINIFIEIEKTALGLKVYSAETDFNEVAETFENNTVYFIKVGDLIVGNASYEIIDNDHVYIDGFIIKPEFQSMGIGKISFGKLVEILGNYKKLSLVTHPDNVKSLKLYKSYGFVVGDIIENAFGDGEPRVRMELNRE